MSARRYYRRHIHMRTFWEEQAANELKAMLKRAGMSYAALADALNDQGMDTTAASLTKKLYRGAFTHSFFMQCAELARRHQAEVARRSGMTEAG